MNHSDDAGSTTVTLSTVTNATELEEKLKDTLQKQFKVEKMEDLADHIILCFPPGFINTSYTNGQLIRMSNDRYESQLLSLVS